MIEHVFFSKFKSNQRPWVWGKSYAPLSLKLSEGILLLRVIGFSVADLLILFGFLAEFEASSAPRTFVIRNKKVKIKSMFLRHMFPPQILMLDWKINGSYRWVYLYGITILLTLEFLIGVLCWNDHYNYSIVKDSNVDLTVGNRNSKKDP